MKDIPAQVLEHLRQALIEDIGYGDITSEAVIPEESVAEAAFRAKGDLVLAGVPFAAAVFVMLDPSVSFRGLAPEGAAVRKGETIAEVSGRTKVLLAGERLGLNILQRMSGIATLTKKYVEAVAGTKAKIADTRKTTPCNRFLEKYAVRTGGGVNHRFGLSDGILIKDNHIAAVGGIAEAVRRARSAHHLLRIEVEAGNLHEVQEALEAGADVIMLDNMSVDEMREAVAMVGGRTTIEASGNVSLGTVRAIAETGVDLISVGALTHSAPAADISMKITP